MSNTNISDDTLASMSLDTDDFIGKLCDTYGTSTLVATSIVLARTMIANEHAGTKEVYRALMNEALGMDHGMV